MNKEKYISFTKYVDDTIIRLRFIDSLRFMNSSLEKLASYMKDLKIVKKEFSDCDDEKFELLRRKGIYPYDFMSSFDRLNDIQLPPKNEFFSTLKNCNISDDDYAHAQHVWRAFECRTLLDYTLL